MTSDVWAGLTGRTCLSSNRHASRRVDGLWLSGRWTLCNAPWKMIFSGSKVHFCRGLIVERLVQALLIVKAQVVRQAFARVMGADIFFHIHLLVFHVTPQAFGKDIVEGAAFAVHADAHLMRPQELCVLWTGKLAALVTIANLLAGSARFFPTHVNCVVNRPISAYKASRSSCHCASFCAMASAA